MPDTFRNPVITDDRGADHGDPFVLKYLDTYYLYHTGADGVWMYSSPDLVHWQERGIVLRPDGSPEHWAQADLWAPEVLYRGGIFYMYVAATRRQAGGHGDDQLRRLGLARSDRPEGPFHWDPRPLVDREWSIDGHPFQDEDGSLWLFYNVRTAATRYPDGTTGCGNVVDRLTALDRLEGRPAPVSYPSARWEGNREGTWYWNEGPFVLKRRGVYYQMYSGGFYGDDTYGIGFATAPSPRGPWTKYAGNPILRSGRGILGPGHHCVVRAPDGVTPYVVYHGYVPGQRGRKVHLDRLFWVGDHLAIAGPTDEDQPMPPRPVFDAAVPHWRGEAWVQGSWADVCGIRMDLTPGGYKRVEAMRVGGTLRVFVDGVLRYHGFAAGDHAAFAAKADGDVRDVMQTSWLEDEGLYPLAAGARLVWAWGGRAALEVSMAVRGRAVLAIGSEQEEIDAPQDRFVLVRRFVPAGVGVDQVAVQAGDGGATVADVTLAAR
ncbi:MAG: glycoside hydrolase family 43 protein [Firmicutes bacterium]|nr:glycoside hydrolase family 43 protein [Bacillota bacterium]